MAHEDVSAIMSASWRAFPSMATWTRNRPGTASGAGRRCGEWTMGPQSAARGSAFPGVYSPRPYKTANEYLGPI
jgi:hypothetical protein